MYNLIGIYRLVNLKLFECGESIKLDGNEFHNFIADENGM